MVFWSTSKIIFELKTSFLYYIVLDAIDFEYVFDDKKNWIEQTKSINGKKLYVWKREIKYFE